MRTIVSLTQSYLASRLVHVVLTAQDEPASWGAACDIEFSHLLQSERSRAAVTTYLECSTVNNVMASNI